jgi:chromosome segregation protein
MKHRQRRDRAIRRMEATGLDMQRLQDLLGEQQRRMRPLRRQARAAERFEDAKAEWRSLRLWLGGERLRAIGGRLAEIATAEGAGRETLSGATDRLSSIDGSMEGLKSAAGDMGRALDRDTAAAARLETTLERLQRIAMVARERRSGLQRRIDGFEQRRRDLVDELADLDEGIAASGTEVEDLRNRRDRFEVSLRALEDEEQSLSDEQGLSAEGMTARLQGEVTALEAAARRDDREASETRRRLEVVEELLGTESSEALRLNTEIREADRTLAALQDRYERAARDRESHQSDLDSAEQAFAAAQVELAAAKARFEALDPPGAAEARRSLQGTEGVVAPLIELLEVPDGLTSAVRAALGAWADGLVVSGAAVILSAAGTVPEGSPVTLVSSDRHPADPTPGSLAELLDPSQNRDLAEALLGDVVLVDTWESGMSVVSDRPEVRAVTRRGDLITRDGVQLAGSDRPSVGDARAAADRARTESARHQSRATVARRDFDESRTAERGALEALEAVETQISGAAEALRLVERSRSESVSERARLTARLATLEESAVNRADRLAELRRRLDAFEGAEAEQQTAWQEAAARRAAVTARREETRRSYDEAAGALAALTERNRLWERRRAEVQETFDSLSPEPAGSERVARLGAMETRARAAISVSRGHLSVLRERQRDLRSSAGAAGARLEAAYAERERLEAMIADCREQLSDWAVEAAELRVREESEAEGVRRDVDGTTEDALAAPACLLPDGVDGWDHAASLEAKLKRLGPVNPLAAAEYRDLAERAEFLEEQLADLETSRSELRKVVAALDEEIGRLFVEAFAEISKHFEENFGLLFPGGTGRLTLTDPDDPLVTGIQIHAQPMGKKVGRLSLLSGGERSLAALAFLFAVFRARPSPFYVLDEVEAALDDANLHRFIRLISTLRDTSQLVVVTHQQQTMEAADLLYGVTMEPGESSRVLAKRLTRTGGELL